MTVVAHAAPCGMGHGGDRCPEDNNDECPEVGANDDDQNKECPEVGANGDHDEECPEVGA